MMTVNEVSKRTGVSIRTLQYYDKIGLLRAAGRTEAGYRLYDDAALERLQQILLFRELEFPLKDIQKIVENPAFDRQKALEQQITLLTLKSSILKIWSALRRKFDPQEEWLWTLPHLIRRRSKSIPSRPKRNGAKRRNTKSLRKNCP